jgi:hypothetical protein
MKRFLLAAVFSSVACAAGFAKSGTLSALTPTLSVIDANAPRYTTEDERIVSEIAGSILNIAAFADHFEPGAPFQVRNVGPSRFSVARRAEVFTVEVRGHVWTPGSYERLARSFMADGAGFTISEDLATDRQQAGLAGATGGEAIARENVRLSRLLQTHPRSPALHERAAMLLAVAATNRATGDADIRPLLCRMTAHLAVARALHGDVLSADGALAERLLAQLSNRQAEIERSAAPATLPAVDGPVTFGDAPSLSILPPA